MTAAILSFGAISVLGEGAEAVPMTLGEAAPVGIAIDEHLASRALARPLAARVALAPEGAGRSAWLLERALTGCVRSLERELPEWRSLRVGLALGTSCGAELAAEDVLVSLLAAPGPSIDPETLAGTTYFAPVCRSLRALDLSPSPATLVLTACAASTIAVGMGLRWLARGACDVVLAGGFDEVGAFVASGFEALRATTGTNPPRPFQKGRDGMSLGEGACVMALVPASRRRSAMAFVTGFGASADAGHLTAPDREGAGLVRAAQAALAEATRERGSPAAVDFISAHGTATPYNDAAEAAALTTVLAPQRGGPLPVLHALKAQIGHTLGAAGALETLSVALAMRSGVLPATPLSGPLDDDVPARVLGVTEAGAPRVALKLSAAFGGANAALVIESTAAAAPAPPRSARRVFVGRAVIERRAPSAPELAKVLGREIERVARMDGLVRLGVAAAAALVGAADPLRLAGAGIVVGHSLAALETNAIFATRLCERGPRGVEPRRFPYTSPNAVAGECGSLFGWTGPGVALGAGLHGAVEALAVAYELVSAGDADRIVVLAVDEGGPATTRFTAGFPWAHRLESGALAVLVSASPEDAVAELRDVTTGVGRPADGASAMGPLGHAALSSLADASACLPRTLEAACPFGGFARALLQVPDLEPVDLAAFD